MQTTTGAADQQRPVPISNLKLQADSLYRETTKVLLYATWPNTIIDTSIILNIRYEN